jgi:chorismate mutase
MSDAPTQRLREQIAAQDRTILAAVNTRLRLVEELREHKRHIGASFVDTDQEQRLLDALAEANPGPLSGDGVRKLFEEILALTKRELGERPA